ncbi:M48 family metalloprotease [Sulfurivirga sp.]|uniref:M48 family metalloprotease n=1 Tax=Sulfurivirga sp. TaxID=2614236 RepID=UPI0025F1B69C|nr:M48 family metalloprotease [Sulfurivirga sp.]
MPLFSRRLAPLFLALALLAPPLPAALPDLGSQARQQLTPQQRQLFRLGFLRSLYDRHAVIEDPILNQWLTRLGQYLAQYADTPEPVTFLLIDSPEINAFAGPGGVIGIHSGLILSARSIDEVAGVIAHEIGHVHQHHLLRRLTHADRDTLTSLATLLAALLIGQKDPQAGMAMFYTGNALNLQNQLNNSRSDETEADALGLQLLHASGYRPEAMADFFELLYQRSERDTHSIPEILRTHPVSQHRLAAAKDRLDTLKRIHASRGTPPPLLPFSLIKDRIRHLEKPERVNRTHVSEAPSWLADLNHALTAIQTRPQHVISISQNLIRRYPDTLAIRLKLARALADTHPQTALQLLDLPLEDNPPPLRTLHADTLADLLARMGQQARARLYAAEANWLKGRWRQAHNLLKELDPAQLHGKERLRYEQLQRQTAALTDA